MLLTLSVIALLVISPLAYYAFHLTRQVKQQEANRQQQQQEEAAQAAHNLRQKQLGLLEDVRFITRSVISEQCEITEGVLRLNYLISGLDADVWQQAELETMRKHYQAVSDMPILEQYKQLSKQEQMNLDLKRWSLEADNKKQLMQECQWLSTYDFPNVTLLQ